MSLIFLFCDIGVVSSKPTVPPVKHRLNINEGAWTRFCECGADAHHDRDSDSPAYLPFIHFRDAFYPSV